MHLDNEGYVIIRDIVSYNDPGHQNIVHPEHFENGIVGVVVILLTKVDNCRCQHGKNEPAHKPVPGEQIAKRYLLNIACSL
jgi:hypothetical protein